MAFFSPPLFLSLPVLIFLSLSPTPISLLLLSISLSIQTFYLPSISFFTITCCSPFLSPFSSSICFFYISILFFVIYQYFLHSPSFFYHPSLFPFLVSSLLPFFFIMTFSYDGLSVELLSCYLFGSLYQYCNRPIRGGAYKH